MVQYISFLKLADGLLCFYTQLLDPHDLLRCVLASGQNSSSAHQLWRFLRGGSEVEADQSGFTNGGSIVQYRPNYIIYIILRYIILYV